MTHERVVIIGKHSMKDHQQGSTELVVLGLLAALIVVLAIPLLGDVGPGADKQAANVHVEQKPVHSEHGAAHP